MATIFAFSVRAVKHSSFQRRAQNVFFSNPSIKTSLYPKDGETNLVSSTHSHESEHHHGTTGVGLVNSYTILNNSSYNKILLAPSFTSRNFLKRQYSTAPLEKKKVAVVLSGCGVYDGSEIHESVSLLIHLSKAGVETKCFAPDIDQSDVINHLKGTPSVEATRNVMVESARITRGKVKPLSQLKAEGYDALFFPGGYGAAKNLCTFAKDGDNCSVLPELERVMKEFHSAKKPIGMCCISPVIAARLIPGVRVTLGNEDKEADDAVRRMGAVSEPVGVVDVVVDSNNRVISTPAYMCNAPVHKVFEGIGKLVDNVITLVNPSKKGKEETASEKK